MRSSAWAREESSEQSSGRVSGAGREGTGPPRISSANSARETSSAPATCSGPADVELGELEERLREVGHLHRAPDLVRVEGEARIVGGELVLGRRPAPVRERRPHEQRVGVGERHADLRLGLRVAVLRQRRERILLDVRRSLAPVEDDVGREVDEPGADRGGRTRDVLGADRVDVVLVLPVGGVDDDVRAQPPEELGDGAGVAHLDPLRGRVRAEADELGAEVAGRAGDVQLHGRNAIAAQACFARRRARR